MRSNADSVAQYLSELPEDRRPYVERLIAIIDQHIPKGFNKVMGYGMIGYVVPHETYPKGYHCDPKLPLPFVNVASQKNFIALYHMGIYSSPELLDWFTAAYAKHSKTKLDMGKSCIRFKKPEHIPFELIGELMSKMGPEEWIKRYEAAFNK